MMDVGKIIFSEKRSNRVNNLSTVNDLTNVNRLVPLPARLTEAERRICMTAKIGSSSEIGALLSIIERLTGEKF